MTKNTMPNLGTKKKRALRYKLLRDDQKYNAQFWQQKKTGALRYFLFR
jgi:hypothetical protein